eukprot:TRINITY_DN31723_c0_g1_i2.p1 TRINITY_DN31723_c0_g1~~TRINITY_DN31723_c0_g1_i2.p1  ORF type:complete len:222 (-),score=67.80 TRINITY_DN31723_c0_g1_i2:36-701(-)
MCIRDRCAKMREKDMTIGFFGCDNAGKTTTINAICGRPTDPEQGATFGMQSHLQKQGHRSIKLLDLGGGVKFRGFWKTNYSEMHGFVFVVDAACPDRLEESAKELLEMLGHEMVQGKPVLILANKQDLPGALSQGEIAKRMDLDSKLSAKKWQIQECVALVPQCAEGELSLIHISEPTRLLSISYAVFCLKKKKKIINNVPCVTAQSRHKNNYTALQTTRI